MNEVVRDLLKSKFGKAKPAPKGSFRIPCPTCDPKHSKKMKRYICPGWSASKCYICGVEIPIAELLGGDVEFERAEEDDTEADYPYAQIAPYRLAVELSSLPETDPVIQFLAKDHLHELAYYDYVGVRYIPAHGGMNLSFDSGFTVHTANALFFPVFDKADEYVGWQLRFIPGTFNGDKFQFMRYMHLFPKGSYLFNYRGAKDHDVVIVVEGAKKALKLGNAVATLGKGISEAQKQLIQEWKKIVIILDGEDNTQELAQEIAKEFRDNGRKCICIDPRTYGFDSPDDATTEELVWMIERCWPTPL